MSTAPYAINDPIHGIMQLSRDEKDLLIPIVNSEFFQRLRYIKQLSFAHLVYPGATHTRFSHCIGTAYLTKVLLENLYKTKSVNFRDENEYIKEKNISMLSGLLHDVGHGPFSHSFEEIKYGKTAFKHEEWNNAIINLLKYENLVDSDILDTVNNILKKHSNHEKNQDGKFSSRKIISSQLDTDRMDYLLRDSHFCGVEYGNYDPNWLIRCLTYSERLKSLAIFRKGVGAIEHYLFARRLMHKYVYLHPKKLICDKLLGKMLTRIYEDLDNNLESIDPYKSSYVIRYFLKIKNIISNSSKDAILNEAVREYLAMTDIDVEILIKNLATDTPRTDNQRYYMGIAKILFYRKLPKPYPINFDRYTDAKIEIDKFKNDHKDVFLDWQIITDSRNIKTYKDENEYADKDESIYIIDEQDSTDNPSTNDIENDRNIVKIDHFSIPIFSLANKEEIDPILFIDSEINSNSAIKSLINKLSEKGCLVGKHKCQKTFCE